MRVALLALPLLAALSLPGDVPPGGFDPHAVIVAEPIPLDLDRPWRRRVGALRFVRGWALSSANVRFGGLSGLIVSRGRLLAISDEGQAIAFTPTGAAMLRPRFRPLPGLGGRAEKVDRDTEALAHDPASGRLWVTTENHNAIWRFAPRLARVEAVARPQAMRRWLFNGGAESLARLPDGRFLAIAEHAKDETGGTRRALLFPGDPTDAGALPLAFRYRPPAGCVPSDAAALPDGRVLVLNRCASLLRGVSAVLVRLDLAGVRPRQVRSGTEIARLARPLTVDNMEALAVAAQADGIHVWIASDDNLSIAQRTLLMEFVLDRERPGARPGRRLRRPASS